jgi:hypothetical protein
MGTDATTLAKPIIEYVRVLAVLPGFKDGVVGTKCPAVVATKACSAGEASFGLSSGKLFGKALLRLLPGKDSHTGRGHIHGRRWLKVVKVQILERNGLPCLQNGWKDGLGEEDLHGYCGVVGASNRMADRSSARAGISCGK